jgi:4'-phosphopantetheinyl transferase EntD
VVAELYGAGLAVVCAQPRAYLDELHPEERARIEAAAPRRRRQFSTGRHCAREALRRLGLPPAALPTRPDRSPAWPDGVVGSISHTDGCCVVVVGASPPWFALGVDVEGDAPLDAKIQARVCRPEEREWLASRAVSERGLLGKVFFSAKEAVYKCQHPLAGASLGFQDVALRLDPGAGRFDAEIRGPLPSEHAGLRRLSGRFARSAGFVVAAVALRQSR